MPTKDINIPIVDVDESKGIVKLYASAFDKIDAHKDVIRRGAFAKSIKERGPKAKVPRIKHLFQHDLWTLIGRPLEMIEDAKGLLIWSKVSDISNGDYLKLYRDGVITEHSIGYDEIKTVNGDEYNELLEVRLWEYSSVTFGANYWAQTQSVKSSFSENVKVLNDRVEKLKGLVRNGDYTDETGFMLEKQIEFVEARINSLKKEPPSRTLKEDEPNEKIDIVKLYNEI